MGSSRLLSPFRTIGLVCGGEQMSLHSLGSETFVATSIGHGFQIYDVDHLNVVFSSPPFEHSFTHTVCYKETTFAVCALGITVWNRNKLNSVLSWETKKGYSSSSICQIMILNKDLLVSLHLDNCIRVWEVSDLHEVASNIPESDLMKKKNDSSENHLLSTIHLLNKVDLQVFPISMIHPDTYINKILISMANGSLILLNIRSEKVIFQFDNISLLENGYVSCMIQSPIVDIIACGTSKGRIFMHNLRTNESLDVVLDHEVSTNTSGSSISNNAITSLSFSSTNAFPVQVLASSTRNGSIALWNLEKKTILSMKQDVYSQGVTFSTFLPNLPLLLSASSSDNTLSIWQLDRLEGSFSLLKQRSGHSMPPSFIRYYHSASSLGSIASGSDASSCEIVSCSIDRTLRYFHSALDKQNCELSQGNLVHRAKELHVSVNSLRLPPITALACSDRRYSQWGDIVTCHSATSIVSIWSWEKKKIEERQLVIPDKSESSTAVSISSCGSFAIVGGSNGTLVKFNLQSGARRGLFPPNPSLDGDFAAKGRKRSKPNGNAVGSNENVNSSLAKRVKNETNLHVIDSFDTALFKTIGSLPQASTVKKAPSLPGSSINVKHSSLIRGIACDLLNSTVMSVDSNGLIIFWDFNTHSARSKLELQVGVLFMEFHRESGLAVLAMTDFSVIVVDISSFQIVRRFHGFSNRVSCCAFSPDARWLTVCSLDKSMRVFDIPSGVCIDWVSFPTAATSISFSPTGENIATSHVDNLGICIWANRAFFGKVVIDSTSVSNKYPIPLSTPSSFLEENLEPVSNDDTNELETSTISSDNVKLPGEDPNSIVLSSSKSNLNQGNGVDIQQWQTIAYLDVIAARNKPKEPVKKPESAPFFLPTSGGLNPVFIPLSQSTEEKNGDENSNANDTDSRLRKQKEGSSFSLATNTLSMFLRQLTEKDSSNDAVIYSNILNHLFSLAITSVDAEIRSLCWGIHDTEGIQLVYAFFRFLSFEMEDGRNYDMIQGLLELCVQVYSDVIISHDRLKEIAAQIKIVQNKRNDHFRESLDSGISIVNSFLGL
jgi:U3 small nucleolar RNA-associated protein 21